MSYTMVENLGWALLHSIWQIALIAVLLFTALRVLAGTSANARYVISILALSISLFLPLATLVRLANNSTISSAAKTPEKENILIAEQASPGRETLRPGDEKRSP